MGAINPEHALALIQTGHRTLSVSSSYRTWGPQQVDVVEVGNVYHLPWIGPYGERPSCGSKSRDVFSMVRSDVAAAVATPCLRCYRDE